MKSDNKTTMVLSSIVGIMGIILLALNRLVTSGSSPDAFYISTIREPLMICAYGACILGVVGFLVGLTRFLASEDQDNE